MALTSITYADGTHDEKDGRPCVEVEVQCTHLTPEEARALVACHRHRNRGGREGGAAVIAPTPAADVRHYW